jgi:hypothetical protein
MKKQIPLFVAALMAFLSAAGLLFQPIFYSTQELRRTFVSNDVVNLLIGLPSLLISFALAKRKKLIGILLLPGALLYITYNYITYSVATWTSAPSFFYIALVGLSTCSAFQSFTHMDKQGIQQKLRGSVPERFAGGVLTVFGLLFFFRGIGQVYSAFANSTSLAAPEMSVVYADLLITPLWILGGLSLWQRQAFGYAAGAGLLFQASMLFVGLLAFFILQPFLTGVPFPAVDFVVILIMGMIFFVPFGLFVRGILSCE